MPLLILLIWGVMAFIHTVLIPIPHRVSLVIVLGTAAWFVVWLLIGQRK